VTHEVVFVDSFGKEVYTLAEPVEARKNRCVKGRVVREIIAVNVRFLNDNRLWI
jgi:hypothetical protein